MLLGWAIRTFGPGLRHQPTGNDTPQSADVLLARFAWRRFISALGAVIATSGVILVLITFFVILIDPGDSAGSIVGWTCFGLILLAVAVWSWFFVGRYGTFGVLPPRRSPNALKSPVKKPQEAAVPAAPALSVNPSEPAMTSLDDAHGFGPDAPESEDFGEYDARYAKYQLHRPEDAEEPESTLEDTGLLPEETDDDDSEAEAEYEVALEPESEDESPHLEAMIPDDSVPEPLDDSSLSTIEGQETLDQEVVPEESSPGNPAGDTDLEQDADAEDVSTSDLDTDNIDPASDSDDENPESEAFPIYTPELEDTPEGRAEALRRIQEWQPADQDDEERS